MGFVEETGDPLVGVETRRESFHLYERINPTLEKRAPQHIFTYGDNGTVEITYQFLRRFLRVLRENPEIAKRMKLKGVEDG